MALLLHLSDLHLATNDEEDVVSDSKVSLFALGNQQTRLGIIQNSLRALGEGLVKAGKSLDSILISGDIAVRGQQEGFDLLDSVLECLGKALPPAERILIVPGNHDIVRYAPHGSYERYKNFLKLRDKPYKTAFLEGVDLDPNGTVLTKTDPVIVAKDESFVLIGLNSANYCGSDTDTESELAPHMADLRKRAAGDKAISALLDAWKARGLADVARLDAAQLIAARARLMSALEDVTARSPLRIAALHHQVQPVTVTEEIKSFDALLNLGEFRDWLVANGIDVIMHGHKHEGKILPDSHLALNPAGSVKGPHDMLLVSAPTIQVGQNGRDSIGYLLDVRGPSARIAGVNIAEIDSLGSGGGLDYDNLTWVHHGIDQPSRYGIIQGETVDDVHGKLLALQTQLSKIRLPLICRISDGDSAHTIPSTYPELPESFGDRQEWFSRMVDWWQKRHDLKSTAFTHGQRLFADGNGTRPSQVDAAISALRAKPSTSRAVAMLMEPHRDLVKPKSEFPAFILVQFTIANSLLNVTAYFRKQEMPHWWPINVGELARLQRHVIDRLQGAASIQAGSITTVTALPACGAAIPRVAVPLLDQRAEEHAGLLDLVLPLFGMGSAAPDDRTAWRLIFDDWRPRSDAAADGDRIPKVGFEALLNVIHAVGSTLGGQPDPIADLVDILKDLEEANSVYVRLGEAEAAEGRKKWLTRVDSKIAKLESVLDSILS